MTTKMPFGKYRGQSIADVFRKEPQYLTWFCDCVDGNEGIKRAIRALPGFCPTRKAPQELDLPNLGVDPGLSRQDLDRLCWEILHPAE